MHYIEQIIMHNELTFSFAQDFLDEDKKVICIFGLSFEVHNYYPNVVGAIIYLD